MQVYCTAVPPRTTINNDTVELGAPVPPTPPTPPTPFKRKSMPIYMMLRKL